MQTSLDILGIGTMAVDDLIYVDRYPPPDAKCPVKGRARHLGGLVATGIAAAARLGARCAFAASRARRAGYVRRRGLAEADVNAGIS